MGAGKRMGGLKIFEGILGEVAGKIQAEEGVYTFFLYIQGVAKKKEPP